MNFYDLNSIISAHKTGIQLHESTDSFRLAPKRSEPYIEPTFTKSEFNRERPTIILISAVGATGKTTLAQVLSDRASLPLLDLARHKPVGDYTLTGLLSSAFRTEDFARVLENIGRGTFGVIIDGIDEGRSKTNEKAFDAFLDDIARLCKNAPATSFVMLGRTQVLDDCWIYLTDKGVGTGLITISPFDLEQARAYIDAFTKGLESSHEQQYSSVRDLILERLSAAFEDRATQTDQRFLSFIGYPPVLDAIVTLLRDEKNYHRLAEELSGSEVKDIEIELLHRIANYILHREKEQKVIPNILTPLLEDMPQHVKEEIIKQVFEPEEQCARLVSHCLGRQISLGQISQPSVDEKYETQLASFLPEHPFIKGRRFQNAVFEAVALSTLIISPSPKAVDLALEYADHHKYNYHLVYLLYKIAGDRKVPICALRVILGSALEFRSRTSSVEINVEGPDAEDFEAGLLQDVDIEIEVIMGTYKGESRSFDFQSNLKGVGSVILNSRLSSMHVSLPCEILISNAQELEFTAPAEISAHKIRLQSPTLTLRASAIPTSDKQIVLEAERLESTLEKITTNGVDLLIALTDRTGLTYPVIQYVEEKKVFTHDPLLKEKYLRLRRILVNFRSHSRGSLARYKGKIDHERVLKNEIGHAILKRLLKDGILTSDGSFYFLQPESVDQHLGVTYIDLRKGRTSLKLEQYLRAIV